MHATIATVQGGNGPRGELRDFDLADLCLLPHDAEVKRNMSKCHDGKRASMANVTTTSSLRLASKKPSIRKTGVHLR